jgi:hypothetical protein
MGQLACLATQLPRGNIALHSFPEELFTASRVYDPVFEKTVFVWDADFLVLRNYVQEFQKGGWPGQSADPGSSSGVHYCQ